MKSLQMIVAVLILLSGSFAFAEEGKSIALQNEGVSKSTLTAGISIFGFKYATNSKQVLRLNAVREEKLDESSYSLRDSISTTGKRGACRAGFALRF